MADTNNHAIRWVNLSDGSVGTLSLRQSAQSKGPAVPSQSPSIPGAGFPGAELLFSQASPPLRFKVQEVSTGKGELSLFVELPKGYKLTAEAFSTFIIQSRGEAARFSGVSPLSLQAPSFPIRIPFEFLRGTGEVVIEASVASCAEDGESLCLLREKREIPIRYSLIPAR